MKKSIKFILISITFYNLWLDGSRRDFEWNCIITTFSYSNDTHRFASLSLFFCFCFNFTRCYCNRVFISQSSPLRSLMAKRWLQLKFYMYIRLQLARTQLNWTTRYRWRGILPFCSSLQLNSRSRVCRESLAGSYLCADAWELRQLSGKCQ